MLLLQQHYSGEMGEFIIFWCEISSGYCTPKIIEIDSKCPVYKGRFLRHGVHVYGTETKSWGNMHITTNEITK